MSFDGIVNVLMALTTVALVTTIVSSKYTAKVIKAAGQAFTSLFLAAQGKRS